MNSSKVVSKLNFQALAKGLGVLFVLTAFFYLLEYSYFMVDVARLDKGFEKGGREVIENNLTLLIGFTSIFLKYALAAVIVAIATKKYVIKNCLFLGAIGSIFSKLASFIFNPIDFEKYILLNLIEVIWALFVCLMIGGLFYIARKRNTQ